MTSLTFDKSLSVVYKNMVGLGNILVDNFNNTYFTNSVSINSNLCASGNTLLIGSTSINSNLNVSGLTILNNSTSINSSLNISGITVINGSTSINNSLNISGSTFINNNLTVLGNVIQNGITTNMSQLNVNGLATFRNGINTNNITSILPTLNINADTINIGNTNSIVNIMGTASYVASTETLIVDKIISLNVNTTTLQGADLGNLSGIEILGISSTGFIRTSNDANRFEIKTPLLNSPINYITTQDLNNNLIISGSTILNNSTTINSSLFVSNNSILNGDTTINNSLNINGPVLLNNTCSINSSLIVSGSTIINNNCSINSVLNVSGNSIFNNNVSINSLLNVSGNSIFNGTITVNNILNINGITIYNNNVSLNSSVNISGVTIINGNTSINSSLHISGLTNIMGNVNVNNNLSVSGRTIINNNVSINSSLNVSGTSIFNNNVTINSSLSVLGQIIAQLPNYNYNIDAKNAGVPVWGFYRTGGIIKIRLNDTPPTLYLSGPTSLNLNINTSYTDPGVYAFDYNNSLLPVYMTINNSSNNNVISNVLITGTSTLVPQMSSLLSGSYTATYSATDDSGLIGLNYRLLQIQAIIPAYTNPTFTGMILDSRTNNLMNGVIYNTNNSTYYYFAQNIGGGGTLGLKYYTSTDGITLTYNNYFVNNFNLTTTGESLFIEFAGGYTYGNNIMIVTIQYNTGGPRRQTLFKSTNNGTTWTEIPGFNINNCDITTKFINNTFFIVISYENNTSDIFRSIDTNTWTKVFTTTTGSYNNVIWTLFADSIIYGNNKYVLTVRSSDNNWNFIQSSDGISWTVSTIPSTIKAQIRAPGKNNASITEMGNITFGNNLFVISNYGTYYNNISFVLTSADLTNWTVVELPYMFNKNNYVNTTGTTNKFIMSFMIFFLYGNFINIHSYSDKTEAYLCVSSDGVNWSYHSNVLPTSINTDGASIKNNRLYIPVADNSNKPYYII
jgi:UDP-3-O-[3-hydroxymyristoyl] glucosamine N-acyltransferase